MKLTAPQFKVLKALAEGKKLYWSWPMHRFMLPDGARVNKRTCLSLLDKHAIELDVIKIGVGCGGNYYTITAAGRAAVKEAEDAMS